MFMDSKDREEPPPKFMSKPSKILIKPLKHVSVQKTAQVMGHKSINFTMVYQRYLMQKDEIRILLDKIEGNQE